MHLARFLGKLRAHIFGMGQHVSHRMHQGRLHVLQGQGRRLRIRLSWQGDGRDSRSTSRLIVRGRTRCRQGGWCCSAQIQTRR